MNMQKQEIGVNGAFLVCEKFILNVEYESIEFLFNIYIAEIFLHVFRLISNPKQMAAMA